MKVYWWRPPGTGYNLGDELTSLLLTRKYKIEHDYAKLQDADLVGVGSSLGWNWERPEVAGRSKKLAVIGSGFMSSRAVVNPLDFLNVYSVRGLLSKNILGSQGRGVTVGDPGLLCSTLYKPVPEIKYKYGVILHHQKIDNQELINRFKGLPVKFLDIRTNDYDSFIDEMFSCEVILSQSLHGLILADAYQLPNVWLNLGSLHSGGEFKFYDYFSSIGRPFHLLLDRIPHQDGEIIAKNTYVANKERLTEVSNNIHRAFQKFISETVS